MDYLSGLESCYEVGKPSYEMGVYLEMEYSSLNGDIMVRKGIFWTIGE